MKATSICYRSLCHSGANRRSNFHCKCSAMCHSHAANTAVSPLSSGPGSGFRRTCETVPYRDHCCYQSCTMDTSLPSLSAISRKENPPSCSPITRLHSMSVPDSNTTVLEAPDSTENISKECDALTNQQTVLSNSNQGFSSTGEEESFAEGGRSLSRARALVDCTPSPYDKDGLAFKKGDIIDILAKSSSGYWVGKLGNQIGHFKFINVEEIPNGDRKSSKRRFSSFENKSNLGKTLEDLLEHLGLEVYMNVLVLNGYHNLDSLKGIEEQDLISLGIVNSDHRIKLLNAIEYFEGIVNL
ncbi:SAM and SH3 domain-containing protein 3 [Araneus ventricosus]|uniref:SAM and SH3 domain-containing protein 3 n=1 Tax=Araneus ventricosus TaxID=182803 RepID=A0A4Y2FHT5_ARAVE|nr:SAM and SH3 domain-containing protein 3 [Araneus ventricosus]